MAPPRELLGLTAAQGEAIARREVGRGAGLWARLYRDATHRGTFDPGAHGASPATAARFATAFCLNLPELRAEQREPADRDRETVKLVLGAGAGLEIETVLVPMASSRWTQCLSSQVGCRMACRFCETGRMGRLRDLAPHEIVGQVVLAATRLGRAPDAVVFQGMGEPCDNLDAVIQSIAVLTDPRGLGYAQERITVCTVGDPDGIARLAALRMKRLNLALSLNAANDALRQELMPSQARHDLATLQRALLDYRQRDNLELAIHYCLMPGINDTRADAAAIAAFCAPLGRAMVHLIPYNPGTAPLTGAPSAEEIDRFVGWLRDAGQPVRRRITKGRSAMAACGQLGNADLRRRGQPRAATPHAT